MIRLSALNDDSSDESEPERTQESIKQAQEAEALELYNRALGYQHSEDYIKAEETYNLLLSSDLVKEAPAPEENEGLNHPGQVLKYSAYKNLAVLAENKGEYEKATDAYLEAVVLDDSDVTVWYHIGKVSLKSFNLSLARQAFEEGLRCNSKHWPCLDELCTVLYAIGDYATCLVMIASALERDENYLKGLALRDKIFKEEAYLKRDYKHLRNLFISFIDEDDAVEASKYVKEALKLREERLKLIEADKADPPPIDPIKPLTSYTWASLGECFVVLYDHLTSPDNPQSLGRTVNLEDYYKAIVTPDISMPHKASLAKAAATADNLAGSSFSTEGFGVYKSTGSSDNDEKIKKAVKRKKPPTSGLENDFPPKRRSARVRTSKKKEEDINYKDLIQSFMPFPLRSIILAEDESSQDSLNDSQSNFQKGSQLLSQDGKAQDKSTFGQSSEYDGVISGEAETLDVLTFVKDHMTNGGIIDLMIKFGVRLAAQRNKKWPSALADVFLKVYSRLRKHVILPSEFVRDQDEAYTAELAKLILVATELTLDKLLTAKSKSSSSLSPASSPRGGTTGVSPIHVGPGISNKFLATDIEYLHCIALDRNIHGDSWLEMAIRVNWGKARYLMLQGQMEIAMLYLDRCTKLLAVEVSPLAEPITVKLVNCKIDNNITLEHVHKKLESLQRCQSLEEVHRLYELGHYEDVVQLLIPTLHQPQPKTKASELGMSIPERPAQLLLLQDSLIKLKNYKKCLECTEVALNEAVSQMSPCEAWSTTLLRLFQCINTCIDESKSILDGFSQVKLQSLTLNIIKVIEASIYSSDVSMEPPLATAFPWVLLCKIIKSKENDEEMEVDSTPKPSTPLPPSVDSPVPGVGEISDNNTDAVGSSSDAPAISSTLRFLRTAHDHLGRRVWCCNNDGIFLLLYVELLREQLSKPNLSSREDLVRDLEQCFLCLYGHPSKKAKLRGLQEHNSCQIPLTWRNSAVVFDYFKPPELPTFDSKTNTISTEVQNLMRRITLVVPQIELEAISFDNVQGFMEGVNDVVPKLPENLASVKRPVVSELFYLLADFYFKNKEFSKALKFYTHDICVQPNRSDSWAGMALIRKSRLESKLNACEPKSEGPIQKHAIAALRCFKRAMETDSTNSSILEEYGSLCYFLHSHASRQLKQFDQEEASMDTRSSLSQRKQDMLVLSEKIFTTALGMDDSEAWLHHYMLGKIAEKLKKSPEIYFVHYEKSSKHLDEDISNYPRKIPFYSPPDHVLEALEVYYRVHVSVLKLLLNEFPDVDKEILEKHLQRAAKGPFFSNEYDVDGGHSIAFRSESTASETSAIEQEKEVVESSSENRASAKTEPSIAPVSQSTLPAATKFSFDAQEDVMAEKSGLAEAVSKDNDGVISNSPLQGQVEKDDDKLGEPREVASAMEITEKESASATSKLLLEQPPDDVKLKEEPSRNDKEDIQPLITEPKESTSSKPQETVLEDDTNNATENKDVSNKPAADVLNKESKNEDVVESGIVSESIKTKEEKEEKMEVEERESMTTALEVSQVESDVAKQPEDTKEFKEFKTEIAIKSNVSQNISKEDTTKSKDSQISEVSEGTSGIEDSETFKAKSVSSYDKPDAPREDEVEVPQGTSGSKNIGVILLKDTSEISKEHPDTQDLEMAKPICTLEGSEESLQKPAVEKTDSMLPEVKDLDSNKQINTQDITKDLLKVTSVDSSKVSPGEAEMQKVVVPMDTKETSKEQDEEMETPMDVKEPSDVSTSKADTVEKLTPAIPMDISQTHSEKEDSKKIVPMDTTESSEAIHESGAGKEALVDMSQISANSEKDKGAESKDTLESLSKDQASVTEPKESCKETPLVSDGSASKSLENDTQTSSLGNKSKSDKEESSTTNQCTPAPSIVKEKKPLTDEQKTAQRELIDVCIHGLEHCLLRFPQHHKSRYRLAYVYYVSPYHKDLQLSRALLLGENTGKAKLQRNPHQGLFNEKSKTNMFSAFWRIPEEDIDRPGSFCTHTHKSVDLLLQVLRDVNEWDSLMNISNLLHRTPEPGKKYLRDNERHFLARRACDFSVEIMSKRVESQDAQVEPAVLSQLVLDAYECWKIAQKYEGTAKISENLVVKAFEMYRAKVPDSPDLQSSGEPQPSVLERAIRFCQQSSRPQTSSTSTTAPQTPADSSIDSQTDTAFASEDIVMSEPPNDVIKKPISNNQSDTTSLQKEAKESNEISGQAPKEKEIEAMTIKNTVSKTADSDLSLNAPTEPVKAGTCSTINTSESKNVFKEASKESKVAEDAFIAKSYEETSSKDTDTGILTEHLASNQQQSGIILAMDMKPSDDLPEAFPKTEASGRAHSEITTSTETPSNSEKTIVETQQAFESKNLKSAVGECSKSEILSSLTGKDTDSTSAVGECPKSDVLSSSTGKSSDSTTSVGQCSKPDVLSSMTGKSSDSPLVGNTKQELTVSLDKGSSYTEPASQQK